jgi:pimeloyl-ACP methyl ester carboxylesterase
MTRPHPTADDLARARARFAAEAKPGAVHTGRYRLRYSEWGDGPTILSVHGLCDEPLSFCMLVAELVVRGFRVIAYDLPNGVDDDAKLTHYRHDHYVDDLLTLMGHFNLDRADVLGTSFGSTITLRALARNPERFRRAVLQGGFAHRPLQPYERWPATLARYWTVRMNQLPFRRKLMEPIDLPQFVNCPPEVHAFLVECSGKTPVQAAASRALTISQLDLRPQLPSIPHPLLMIGGDRDAVIPRASEADVERGVANARRVEFTPCGHYPQYTMPVPYAEAVAEFLESGTE